jgi:glycerol-3-phosphate cytidylyltransferase
MQNKRTKSGQRIGYTTGVFDLFHIGHLNLLKNAKSYCYYLIVGVTTDELVKDIKGKGPVIPFKERFAIVENLKCVDRVEVQSEIDEIGDYYKYSFDLIFKGSDWENSEKWMSLKKKFQGMGVDVMFFPYTKSISSTKLRNYLFKEKP